MKILIAPDKFKGVADSQKIADILGDAVQKYRPQAEIHLCPLADGGDGTLSSVLHVLKGTRVSLSVYGPLLKPVQAHYGVSPLPQKGTAVIEMAQASGLSHLSVGERNPLETTTFGTGELVLDAVEKQDCRNLLVTLGGSATVDGGLGFLQALGAKIDGISPLKPGVGGKFLSSVVSVDLAPALQKLKGASLTGLIDVQNPLLGSQGAARVYGPQKGASPQVVETLEAGLSHLADVLEKSCGRPLRGEKGAGAAGGLGLALLALGGKLESGFDFVAGALHLEERIRECGLVLTGEGRLDDSTRQGKTVVGVSRLSKKWGSPCVAVAGVMTGKLDWLGEEGISKAYALFETPFMGDDPRRKDVPRRLAETVEKILGDFDPP